MEGEDSTVVVEMASITERKKKMWTDTKALSLRLVVQYPPLGLLATRGMEAGRSSQMLVELQKTKIERGQARG